MSGNPQAPVMDILMQVQPGDVLAGKYLVDKVLGAGGMGVVVKATHIALQDCVAIKFLQPYLVADESVAARFLREAQAAVRIKSPNVARVVDVGKMEDGAPYMVMEYLEGRDLSQLIEDLGRLDVQTACGYCLQVCAALAAAHCANIVHRDIKPGNLFVTREGDGSPLIKVLDFGISKLTGPDAAKSKLTRTHTAIGSPTYMSPEQMRSSKDVDARADIWSLGVVLYEMLTGELPYKAESMPELISAVLESDAPRARALRPEVPEELDKALAKCLARSAADRFQDVAELAAALAPFAGPAAADKARRVSRILRPDGQEPASSSSYEPLATQAATVAVVAAGSSTKTAFGRTDPAPHTLGKRRMMYFAIAGAACVALGSTWLMVRNRSQEVIALPGSSAATASPISSGELVVPGASGPIAPVYASLPDHDPAAPRASASSSAAALPESGPPPNPLAGDTKGGRSNVPPAGKTTGSKAKKPASVFDDRQ